MIYPLAETVTILGMHFNAADVPNTPLEWAWLLVGISGSGIFGIRFFIQWMHSEKHKESRIPISFWWLSVAGTLMAASYFIHKHQWVALLGNGPQLIPYTRNLVLIYRKRPGPPATPAPPVAPAVVPARVNS
jgi:lipid-A-disaccharide synthase-like uncharacterized protein